MEMSDMVTPGEAALILRRNPRTIARWADEGRLGTVTVTEGGQRRFGRAAVETLAAELEGTS
jgi:excisionase family DNA binding protein